MDNRTVSAEGVVHMVSNRNTVMADLILLLFVFHAASRPTTAAPTYGVHAGWTMTWKESSQNNDGAPNVEYYVRVDNGGAGRYTVTVSGSSYPINEIQVSGVVERAAMQQFIADLEARGLWGLESGGGRP